MSKIQSALTKIAAALAITTALAPVAGAAPLSVGMGTNYWFTNTLQNKLSGQGYSVSVIDSYTAASLSAYNVYIQDGNSYFDQDALKQFVVNGGTLIELPWSLNQNYQFSGDLQLMNGPNWGGSGFGANPGIQVLDASSSLLTGVTVPAAGAYTVGYEYGTSFTANAHQILRYADGSGTSLLGEADLGKGHVIALNLHMITSDSNPLNAPWNDQIVYNAVEASVAHDVPEPMSLALVGLGLTGLALSRRKRNG
jgi:hypothetical protein